MVRVERGETTWEAWNEGVDSISVSQQMYSTSKKVDERYWESRYILRYIQDNLFNDCMREREGEKIISK